MRKLVVAAVVVLGLAGCKAEADPTPVQSASPGNGGKAAAVKKAVPIKLTAKHAKAARSILSDGGALSCVRVTVTNQTKKNLHVNPLYFSVTRRANSPPRSWR